MREWSYFLPDVLPHVVGCPSIIAEQELKRAAQQFFEKTRAWRLTTAPVRISANQSFVTVNAGDGLELVRIEHGTYDGKRLNVISPDALDDEPGMGDWRARQGTPIKLVQSMPGVVELFPIPVAATATGLTFFIAAKPSESSLGLPDHLATAYRDSIVVGAKAKLMLYKDAPWSNAGLAATFEATFNEDIGNANFEAAKGFSRGRMAARPKWC